MDKKKLYLDNSHQEYFNNLYKGKSGYIGYQLGEKELAMRDKIDLTYGEILYPGVNAIVNAINIDEEDVFYDLGSGIGKVVLQMFLTTNIKKAIGIEASEARHNCATEIFDLVKQDRSECFVNGRECKSIQGNFLLQVISDATIVFTNSRCFSVEMLRDLTNILNNCNYLKYVLSLQPLSLKLPFKRTLNLECSWLHEDKTKCYIYSN